MIGVADLRSLSLFDGVTEDQLAELVAAGDELHFDPGDVLFQEGEPADAWWVFLDGAVDLVRHVGREDVVVATIDVPGRWAGGFRAWDQHGVYLATGRAASSGRLLRVPSAALHELSRAWFPLAVHLIEGLYSTARNIESTVRQRESLVTLGTLAAGLAHEINNPAAASTRAVDMLENASALLLGSLGRLARAEITPQQFSALDSMRQELGHVGPMRDALALADEEERVTTWLERHGVEDPWEVAPLLVAGGADTAWCDRVAAVLEAPALGSGLVWVASALSVGSLLEELKESSRRISELVGAVRSYSQMDRGSRQQIDVTEGIDSSIAILGHKLREGVTVVREYDADLPRIDAYAGELNQVWTNLIDNAVDAMEGSGTLRVSTRREVDAVVVEVADTGHGMPPETAARAFDAFFTTKEVGTGTGLGLDIARRIVEKRHRGSITIDTSPAGTAFRVRLPIAGTD